MSRATRALLLTSASATLVLSSLATPTAGTSPAQVSVIQGFPGQRLDICIDGKEVKSRVRYGSKKLLSVADGVHKLKAFKKDPRRCKGKLVAKRTFSVVAGDDLTFVIARGKPNVIAFDNGGLPLVEPAVPQWPHVFRHAADFGSVEFHASNVGLVVPSFDGLAFEKGDMLLRSLPVDGTIVVFVTRPGANKRLAGPRFWSGLEAKRYGYTLVGSSARNLRIVRIARDLLGA